MSISISDTARAVFFALARIGYHHGMYLPEDKNWQKAFDELVASGLAMQVFDVGCLTDKGKAALVETGVEELREALKPFARFAQQMASAWKTKKDRDRCYGVKGSKKLTYGDFRRAANCSFVSADEPQIGLGLSARKRRRSAVT